MIQAAKRPVLVEPKASRPSAAAACSLDSVPEGTHVCLTSFNDFDRGNQMRLVAFGLLPGVEFTVVGKHGWGRGGPIILDVKSARVLIGGGMARKILVSRVSS